jgi:aspartate/methionine/tyrosine aminotransferase
VPGRAFGQPDHIRISYANDLDSLAEAYQRIADFIQTKGNMEA